MSRHERVDGWLFDAYAEDEGMRVWVLSPDGTHADFLDPWRPGFRVGGTPAQLEAAESLLSREKTRIPIDMRRGAGLELYSEKTIETLDARVPLRAHAALVKILKDAELPLYDADLHPVQAYHYERGHFPLARCAFLVDAQRGRLLEWTLKDDPWALDYALPPLKTLHLSLSGSEMAGRIDPRHAPRGVLVMRFGGLEHELTGTLEEQLSSLESRLRQWDPDLIETEWGDSWLLPQLELWSKKMKRPLSLSRDPSRGVRGGEGKSFESFGKQVYQLGNRHLSGRWHIDLKNSFMHRESGRDGLIEICRVARMPVQRAARATIGTALTSMQLHRAFLDGILIPMDKQQAEDFRPAGDLLDADKGGLVYEPETGWHENVVEYDFASMYPAVMFDKNISPETVNCPCCPENKVPGTSHHLCRRRRGLIPKVIGPILAKRAAYKKLAKSISPKRAVFKARADAYKWIMVTVFGYLGFKNARFGKIEAHECVNAWGREVLLKAKEAAESRGFHMLHALVDALWLQGGPGTDYEALRRAIEKESGVSLALEGVYKWIRFCPSKTDPLAGVPARYFGAFQDGSLKARGLAYRRRDTPGIVKQLQEKMLARLAEANSLEGCRRLVPALSRLLAEARGRLDRGGVGASELAITINLSKSPEEYKNDSLSALAAKKLAASGLELHPGESLRFVITSAKDAVKDWRAVPLALLEGPLEYDRERYKELLSRAAQEILDGLEGKKNAAILSERPQELFLPLVYGVRGHSGIVKSHSGLRSG